LHPPNLLRRSSWCNRLVKVSPAPLWLQPRTSLPRVPQPAQPLPDPGNKELGEQIARWVGRGSQTVAMAPRFLESRPWLLELLKLREAGSAMHLTALGFGGVATVALATAGALEVADGVRHRNYAEIFVGAGEIARAGYVGTWTGSLAASPSWASGLEGFSQGAALVSGAFQVAGGLARLAHKKKPDNPVNPKIVGLLEAGQGVAWMASMLGAPVGAAFVVKMALATAKTLYTHQEKWQNWTHQEPR